MTDQPEVSLERHAQVWLETAGGHGLGSGVGKTPKIVYRKADGKGAGTAGGRTPCREEEEKVGYVVAEGTVSSANTIGATNVCHSSSERSRRETHRGGYTRQTRLMERENGFAENCTIGEAFLAHRGVPKPPALVITMQGIQ